MTFNLYPLNIFIWRAVNFKPLFLQTPSIPEDAFYQTDLGRLHRSIPLRGLAKNILSTPQIKLVAVVTLFKVEGGLAGF